MYIDPYDSDRRIEEFLREHNVFLKRIVAKRLSNFSAGRNNWDRLYAEALQEARIAAVKAYQKYDGREVNWEAMLITYVCRAVRDWIVKQRHIRHEISCSQFAEIEEPSSPETIQATEDSAVIDWAMSRLTPRQRSVMILRFKCGLSQESVAEQLGLARQTVAEHEGSALRRMRRELVTGGEPK